MFGNIPSPPENQQGYVYLVNLPILQIQRPGHPRNKFKESPRHAATVEARAPETVHPKPGPRRGNVRRRTLETKTTGVKERKRKVRVASRRPNSSEGSKLLPGTCRASPGVKATARFRRTVDFNGKRGWEITLISEIRAELEGVIWIGEGTERTVIVHSEQCGVLLRGSALETWLEGKQRKSFANGSTRVQS